MASGCSIDQACIEEFNKLKLKHHCRYIIYSLDKKLTQVEVSKIAPKESTYEDMVEDMVEAQNQKECRYAVFDAEYTLPNGQKRQKLVFYIWCPESASVKQKMVYTSTKDALKKCLTGVAKEMQCNDLGDLEWGNTLDTLIRTEQGGQ